MIAMIHIQMGENSCSIELMCDILESGHDSMGPRNGFIGLPHIHVQSNFVGRSLGCNHYWGYPTGRLLDFLDYAIP